MKSQLTNWEFKAIAPTKPINNASSFAQWVFEESNSRTSASHSDNKYRQKGRAAHLAIDNFFRMEWARSHLNSESLSDWVIEHTEKDGRAGKYFMASSLTINGKPLNCSPDLILRHKEKSQVLIIERKTTFVPYSRIPFNGWPNLQAQLWCYSWMNSLLNVSEVILVGQIWRHIGGDAFTMCDNHFIYKRSDKKFNQRCQHWFELYGGKFKSTPLLSP